MFIFDSYGSINKHNAQDIPNKTCSELIASKKILRAKAFLLFASAMAATELMARKRMQRPDHNSETPMRLPTLVSLFSNLVPARGQRFKEIKCSITRSAV